MLTPNAERVLFFTDYSSLDSALRASLCEHVPDLEIHPANSVQGYLSVVQERGCALAVLDYDIASIRETELLARLRLLDDEPEVLLLSRCDSTSVIKRIAESNKRYVVRDSQVVSALSLAIRDLMRIRRLEREMSTLRSNLVRANAMLEEQNDRLDDFCVTLAHDIRVPLSALSLKIEYLLDGQAKALNKKGQEMLASSADTVHRLMRVVESTYDLSRLGQSEVSMSPVDVKDLVLRVSNEMPKEANHVLELECDDFPPVLGNEDLLQRVFLNLMHNSVKYSGQQTTKLSFKYIRPERADEVSQVQIECGDNGPGIPSVDQERVFAMFQRGSNRGDKDGLGIGLAIVRRIVELHRGTVTCIDHGNQGNGRLVLCLPRAV